MKMQNKKKHTDCQLVNTALGFTLIEIMVAVSIFAIVMVISIGAVLSIVGANKKAQAYNTVITNLNFALEGMMRDLRTGSAYDCDADGTVVDCPNGSTYFKIKFTSSQYGASVVYRLNTISKQIEKSVNGGVFSPLTSDEVGIDRLQFYVTGTPAKDSLPPYSLIEFRQPKIVIVISGTYGGYGTEARFNMQTTVSQRKLDI